MTSPVAPWEATQRRLRARLGANRMSSLLDDLAEIASIAPSVARP